MPGGKTPGPSVKDPEQYEDWTEEDLEKRAAEIGIDGRSKMDKGELIDALRNH
jgi:hypothetical protein